MRRELDTEASALVDYVAVVDADSFEPIEKVGDNQVVIAVAASFGKTRLIDNVLLNRRQ